MKEVLLQYGFFVDGSCVLECGKVVDITMVEPLNGKMIHFDETDHPLGHEWGKDGTKARSNVDLMMLIPSYSLLYLFIFQ